MSSIQSEENQQHASAMTPLLDEDPNEEEKSFPTQQLFKFAWQIAKGMVGIISLRLNYIDPAIDYPPKMLTSSSPYVR